MTTNEKRAAIIRVYSSESWQQKVAKMSDAQVVAIYRKFLADGKFDDHNVVTKLIKANLFGKLELLPRRDKKEEPAKETCEQLVMDGFKIKK